MHHFWFSVVAASLRVHDVKQNMATPINLEWKKKSLSKCFSIFAFKSRQKIHSSLRDDEDHGWGPLKYDCTSTVRLK